jgi:hypothetical protein
MTLIRLRIKKLEESLATKERALFWLETAKAEGGFIRYVELVSSQPELKAWISNQEACFLHGLVCYLNMAALSRQNALSLQLRFARIALFQSLSGSVGIGGGDEIVKGCRLEFIAMIEDTLAFKEAVAEVSETYFKGHEVLFEDAASQLESVVDQFRRIAAEFNDVASSPSLEIEPIKIDETTEACREGSISSSLGERSGFSRTSATGARFRIASAITAEVSPRKG